MRNRKALLLAPLAAPLVFWFITVLLLARSDRGAEFWQQVGVSISFLFFIAVPLSYVIAGLLGVPVYLVLARGGWVGLRSVILVGLIIGAVSFEVIGLVILGRAALGWGMAGMGAAMGGSVAIAFWALRDVRAD